MKEKIWDRIPIKMKRKKRNMTTLSKREICTTTRRTKLNWL